MEKRLNKKIESYLREFKDNIRNKVNAMGFEETTKTNELLEYVYDYERLIVVKDDLIKRKRIKNVIPSMNRCCAKRCNGEQCTRRRKDKNEFCGTHVKGTPHGLVNLENINSSALQKVEVFIVNMMGIMYYVDLYNNVYSTEDILDGIQNPKIVAKYAKDNEIYSITDFSA